MVKAARLRLLKLNQFRQESWLRWQIARYLDKRGDTCWAELVMWVDFKGFWEFLDLLPGSMWYGGSRSCRQDARQHGRCYCGKFASKSGANEFNLRDSIIVTETVEPDDVPDVTTLTFKP